MRPWEPPHSMVWPYDHALMWGSSCLYLCYLSPPRNYTQKNKAWSLVKIYYKNLRYHYCIIHFSYNQTNKQKQRENRPCWSVINEAWLFQRQRRYKLPSKPTHSWHGNRGKAAEGKKRLISEPTTVTLTGLLFLDRAGPGAASCCAISVSPPPSPSDAPRKHKD